MSTDTTPRTRSAALAIAEDVTLDQLQALLEESGSVAILRPRSPRRLAYVTQVHLENGRLFAAYEYCDRKGYTQAAYLSIGTSTRGANLDPVLDFYNLDRLVRVAP